MVAVGAWLVTTVSVAGWLVTLPKGLLTRTVKDAPLSDVWALVSV